MSTEGGRDYDERKLFVGGLSWDTTEDSLRCYFSQFGEVEEVSVKKDKQSNKPRGFGFVTFKDACCIPHVLDSSRSHELDGKKIDPKLATAKHAVPPPVAVKTDSTKVFVGGIPPLSEGVTLEMLQAELKDILEAYPTRTVKEVEIKTDTTTGRHRGFGFVTFTKSEEAEDACRIHFFSLRGKDIEIKRADPRQSRQGGGGYSGGGGQMGYYPQQHQHWEGGAYGTGSYGYSSGSEYSGYYPYNQGYPQHQSGSSAGQMTGYENYGYSPGSARGDTSATGYGQNYQSYAYSGQSGHTGHTGYGSQQQQQQQQQSNYYGHPTAQPHHNN